ncbi:MAG: hypothetical protein MUQ32_00485 [Chloroflexi bacterium]|nr:hypothetical protein [Chloroflexota bacterium]
MLVVTGAVATPTARMEGRIMREPLVAWAGDCLVRGSVDLEDGRLSDQLNERELVTFFDATLEALDDGHQVAMDELEVDRGELHVIQVTGRRGDPTRRLRTVEERVMLRVGPFTVTGNLHRPPSSPPLAALNRWARFVPVTDAVIHVGGAGSESVHQVVVLVNRAQIAASQELAPVPMGIDEPREPGTAIS